MQNSQGASTCSPSLGEEHLAIATVAAASGEELVPFDMVRTKKSVFQALADARAIYGGKRPIIIDGDDRAITYDDIVRASLALGHALKKGTKAREAVGIMLPTSAGSIISFFAISAFNRVPAMLNFTNGAAGVTSACRTAKIKRIVTARRFIELAKLDGMIAELANIAEIVYLEDVREKLGVMDKLTAGVGQFLPGLVSRSSDPDEMAVILFTSGTEGLPKGVALSHANILSNVEQCRAHVALYPNDAMFNPLPTFHCFGLTAGSLMPLLLGMKSIYHPTPLQPHEIVRRIKAHGATILLSTDTFLSQYARAGEVGDLNSLRMAICGAERVRDETRQLFKRKYAMDILEGYGVTETSPVAAVNQPGAARPGTVGRLMPGMQARLEPVEGIPGAGRLFLKGPNVMLGYIRPENPGVIEPLKDGWHDTGDVVAIDEDGFVAIKGRMKRFAKVGGEVVSLAVVENCASAVWPEFAHAAIAFPDGRKGEAVTLVTTNPEADRMELIGWVHNHGVSELAIPRKIVHVPEIPVLGTGKTDYVKVEKMAAAAVK
jgi:acyl-[acyl-carrier-protein]-phospholipid O-acyltransferase/long-chain-fatty-acid--[acyl-carrier-protein] ligase